MNPKDKAQEIFNEFKFVYIPNYTSNFEVRQCALIVVDKIITQLNELCKPEYTSFWFGKKAGETVDGYELQEYWAQVRSEIIILI